MVDKKEKPQLEFILSLNKIKDIYNNYKDIKDYDDVQSSCYYYETKKSFSEANLRRLEYKCESSWNIVLSLLCESIIKKCEKNDKSKKIFSKELKKAKLLKEKVKNNTFKVGDYEQIYLEELQDLKEDFEAKVEKENIEWKRFWWGILVGFIFGVGGSIVLYFLGFA